MPTTPSDPSNSPSPSPSPVPARPIALIGLPRGNAAERTLVLDAARAICATIVEVESRADLLRKADHLQPEIIVINLSSEDGVGGAAVAGLIDDVTPESQLIFTGAATEKEIVRGVLSGDHVIPRPADPAIVAHTIREATLRGGLRRTGRYQRAHKFDPVVAAAGAMRTVAAELQGARHVTDVAGILARTLRLITPFDLFALIPKPLGTIASALLSCPDAGRGKLDRAEQDALGVRLANLAAERFTDPSPGETVLRFDHTLPLEDAREGAPGDVPTWDGADFFLHAGEEPLAVAVLLRRAAIDIPAPLADLIHGILDAGGRALERIFGLRHEQAMLVEAIIHRLDAPRLWIDPRREGVVANAPARALLGLDPATRLDQRDIESAVEAHDATAEAIAPLFDRRMRKETDLAVALQTPAGTIHLRARTIPDADGLARGSIVFLDAAGS